MLELYEDVSSTGVPASVKPKIAPAILKDLADSGLSPDQRTVPEITRDNLVAKKSENGVSFVFTPVTTCKSRSNGLNLVWKRSDLYRSGCDGCNRPGGRGGTGR